jgi:heme/copper-type cytochrome/quinol oxidase subunit 3
MSYSMNHIIAVPPAKIPQGRLAMWILIAGELIIFGGLIACYLLYRLRYPAEWGAMAAHTSTPLGALNTMVLLTSSFTVVKAHECANKRDRGKLLLWMLSTISLGLVFLVVKGIEYSTEISHGFTFTSPALVAEGNHIGSLFWTFYYIMTGLHATHVIVGMLILYIVTAGAMKGENYHRIELGGLYWHMVDIIWIFLFPLLYLAQ